MLSCNKCGYGFNFKKASEIIDEFKKISKPSEFIEESLQDNNKIIGEFTLGELSKNKDFSTLENEQKVKINTLYKFTKSNLESKGLLICSFCKFVKFIDPNQILLEDTFVTSTNHDDVFHTHLRTKDNTLPRTREYNCYNKKCPSYKNPKLREAVIYRKRNTMHTTYMCCACNEYWSIS